ncbi:hypothetical protein J1N35_028989 [Gossypium stocksii]|uniref:Uncharacterized protein n=1 Tax=Gossypium stocksii TaxID=47602 RepID=A0A9D3UY24_9ROSI|nr:hypothetical protein J1N35_028989 [Gossypium stocksii]
MARIRQVAETLNWELFCEKTPSVDEELVHEFYATLTLSELIEVSVHGIKTVDVGKIILREMWNCAVRRSGPQRVEESEDPEEQGEEDPIEIELLQLAKIPDKVELMEPEAEPNVTTQMFRTQSPLPDL